MLSAVGCQQVKQQEAGLVLLNDVFARLSPDLIAEDDIHFRKVTDIGLGRLARRNHLLHDRRVEHRDARRKNS